MTRPCILAALLAPLFLSLPAAAQAPAATAHQVGFSTERSNLDNGYADWREAGLNYRYRWHRRGTVELGLRETRRFGLDDTEISAGATLPATDALTLELRATASDTHRVLPRHSYLASAQYEFRPAWLIHGTWRQTAYDATDVRQASLMLEHYFADFSAALALHHVRALGETTRAVELRGAWYYAEGSSLAVYASSGDEATQVGGGTVALAKVRSVALVGRHTVAPRWTLEYGLHRSRQGDFYRRTGVSLGVQHAF